MRSVTLCRLAVLLVICLGIWRPVYGSSVEYYSLSGADRVDAIVGMNEKMGLPVVAFTLLDPADDRIYYALVDTGAGVTTIRAGLCRDDSERGGVRNVRDFRGATGTLPEGELPSFCIGDLVASPKRVILVPDDNPVMQCLGVDMILGMDVMHYFTVIFDRERSTVTFLENGEFPFVGDTYSMQKDEWGRPYARFTFGEGERASSGLLLVDTGSGSVVSLGSGQYRRMRGILEDTEYGRGSTGTGIYGRSKPEKMYRGRVKARIVGSTETYTASVTVRKYSETALAGMGFFNGRLLVLDFPNSEILYVPGEWPRQEPTLYGHHLAWDGGQWVVTSAWGDLARYVSPGDILTAPEGFDLPQGDSCYVSTVPILFSQLGVYSPNNVMFDRKGRTVSVPRRLFEE